MPARSLSGESIVQASQILPKQDTLEGTGLQSRLIDVYELLRLARAIERILFNSDSESPASQKVIAAYVASQLLPENPHTMEKLFGLVPQFSASDIEHVARNQAPRGSDEGD